MDIKNTFIAVNSLEDFNNAKEFYIKHGAKQPMSIYYNYMPLHVVGVDKFNILYYGYRSKDIEKEIKPFDKKERTINVSLDDVMEIYFNCGGEIKSILSKYIQNEKLNNVYNFDVNKFYGFINLDNGFIGLLFILKCDVEIYRNDFLLIDIIRIESFNKFIERDSIIVKEFDSSKDLENWVTN